MQNHEEIIRKSYQQVISRAKLCKNWKIWWCPDLSRKTGPSMWSSSSLFPLNPHLFTLQWNVCFLQGILTRRNFDKFFGFRVLFFGCWSYFQVFCFILTFLGLTGWFISLNTQKTNISKKTKHSKQF